MPYRIGIRLPSTVDRSAVASWSVAVAVRVCAALRQAAALSVQDHADELFPLQERYGAAHGPTGRVTRPDHHEKGCHRVAAAQASRRRAGVARSRGSRGRSSAPPQPAGAASAVIPAALAGTEPARPPTRRSPPERPASPARVRGLPPATRQGLGVGSIPSSGHRSRRRRSASISNTFPPRRAKAAARPSATLVFPSPWTLLTTANVRSRSSFLSRRSRVPSRPQSLTDVAFTR